MLRSALCLTALCVTPAPAQLQVVERVSVSTTGHAGTYLGATHELGLSADGRYVIFVSYAGSMVPGDTNGVRDVFRHDRWTGTTIRCSVGSAGQEADNDSYEPAISGDGRYVAFLSDSDILDPLDTNGVQDVYLHDTQTGTTERISKSAGGLAASSGSREPALNHDGSLVAFQSLASNLVAGDINAKADIFVYDRTLQRMDLVSHTSGGGLANGGSRRPFLSGDGRYVFFESSATNLGTGDTTVDQDVYAFDRQTGALQQVIGVREHDLRAALQQLARRHAFHGSVGPDRHERRGRQLSMPGAQASGTRRAGRPLDPELRVAAHAWINIASP